jgi:hypothetical protein
MFSLAREEAWMFKEERRVLEPELISREVNMTGAPLLTVGVVESGQETK